MTLSVVTVSLCRFVEHECDLIWRVLNICDLNIPPTPHKALYTILMVFSEHVSIFFYFFIIFHYLPDDCRL